MLNTASALVILVTGCAVAVKGDDVCDWIAGQVFPEPTLILQSDHARQGQVITIDGERFNRFELVNVYFSDELIPTEIMPRRFGLIEHQADRDGAFTLQATVPSGLPIGSRWVVAIRREETSRWERVIAERLFVTRGEPTGLVFL